MSQSNCFSYLLKISAASALHRAQTSRPAKLSSHPMYISNLISYSLPPARYSLALLSDSEAFPLPSLSSHMQFLLPLLPSLQHPATWSLLLLQNIKWLIIALFFLQGFKLRDEDMSYSSIYPHHPKLSETW